MGTAVRSACRSAPEDMLRMPDFCEVIPGQPGSVGLLGADPPGWGRQPRHRLCQVRVRLPVGAGGMFGFRLLGDHGSGVSLTRIPWAGRPALSTSRTQPSHFSPSFTTLRTSTFVPL